MFFFNLSREKIMKKFLSEIGALIAYYQLITWKKICSAPGRVYNVGTVTGIN